MSILSQGMNSYTPKANDLLCPGCGFLKYKMCQCALYNKRRELAAKVVRCNRCTRPIGNCMCKMQIRTKNNGGHSGPGFESQLLANMTQHYQFKDKSEFTKVMNRAYNRYIDPNGKAWRLEKYREEMKERLLQTTAKMGKEGTLPQ